MLDRNLFFPTILASDTNQELAELMLPIAKKYLQQPELLSTLLDYKSTYDPSNKNIEKYKDSTPFINYLEMQCIEYLESTGYDSSKIKLSYQLFVSEMIAGDFHIAHVHPNSLLSGVFYLQAPLNSSPIVFSDPRLAKRMISLPKKEDTMFNENELVVFPKTGMFLMWESWLMHHVPKNHSVEGRITMVFNVSCN
jgi:uncharacterized protein (TIGR02466 family)